MTAEKRPPPSSARTCAGRHSTSCSQAAPGSSRRRSPVDGLNQRTSPVSRVSMRSHALTSTSIHSPARSGGARWGERVAGSGERAARSRIDGSLYDTDAVRARSRGPASCAPMWLVDAARRARACLSGWAAPSSSSDSEEAREAAERGDA
eukprot:scaffold315233_cov26-Tisochrysis_lutea.AAC.4